MSRRIRCLRTGNASGGLIFPLPQNARSASCVKQTEFCRADYFASSDPAAKTQIGNWFAKITTDNVIEGEAGMFFNSVKGFLLDSTDGVQNYANLDAQSIAQEAYPTLQLAGDDPNATADALAQAQKQQNLQYQITKYFGAMPGPLTILDDGTTLTIANDYQQVSISGTQTVVSVKDGYGNMTAAEYNQSGVLVDTMHIGSNGAPTDNVVYNASGHETEYATFGSNGEKTQDIFYDATSGRTTEQDDFKADGSAVATVFNADGSQSQYHYNTAGNQTEQAEFGSNGKITQDVVDDPTTGRETQEIDYGTDGSWTAHLLNSNGTENAIVYNAAGHETEYATFGSNGEKTQDIFYDATSGRTTEQDDFKADGSGVAHIFNPDGTQDSAVFDPSGHVSEYATFAANGRLTADAFFDANERLIQLNEYSANQTIVHLLNANGTQTATVYNGSNQETEFAAFDTQGRKTDDWFFDGPTGRNTEYDQYGSNGSMTAHLFNANGTQNAIVFNGNGQEMEYDSFDASGNLTGFTKFTYGVGGGYNAVAYGPTGYEFGWSDYSGDNMLLSSGGNQYNFTLDDSYDSGSDDFDFGSFDNSNEYGFYI